MKAQGVAAALVACQHAACGQPQTGPGHPRKGWVKLHQAGAPATVWCCGWHCASRYAIRQELREAQP